MSKRRFLFLVILIMCGMLPGGIEAAHPMQANLVNHLSPPMIDSPIYPCARVVVVRGYTVGATVSIYANDTELLAQGTPWYPWWVFRLNRPVQPGDILTAQQTLDNDTSYPTRNPVEVGSIPPEIDDWRTPPILMPPIYACQQQVSVRDLLQGAFVELFTTNGALDLTGRGDTAFTMTSIGTRELIEGEQLVAQQSMCDRQFVSPLSQTETVLRVPSTIPDPKINTAALYPGSTIIDVYDLVTGAVVDIMADGTRIGGGIAPGSHVAFPVTPPVQTRNTYTATQALCETMATSAPEYPSLTLPEPVLLEPICEGASTVVLSDTVLNALLKIYVEGGSRPQQVGQGSGTGGSTTLALGDTIFLQAGEAVVATQEIGSLLTQSAAVRVSPITARPVVTVENGLGFFAAEAGEQPITGPVFLRGAFTTASFGPTFRVVFCGSEAESATVDILFPGDRGQETIQLTALGAGHFWGGWNWHHSGWSAAGDIPVGEYRAVFRLDGQQVASRAFYVIFDPAEVTASARFAFNETGIWFGTGYGSSRALTYALHPDDNRVFSRAISAVAGETDMWTAATKMAQFEHNMFGYDLNYHGNDVVNLIEHETTTQCADDANMLTALLRAVGIPAHPVTADAALENGGASWTFDTWVEARLPGPAGEQWYALHSHQSSSAQGPVIRTTAGNSWGEATKSANDVIIMANQNWIATEVADGVADLRFGYNTPCKEPSQIFDYQATWVDNISNPPQGYWSRSHWECSPPLQPQIFIEVDRDSYAVGDPLIISIHISNEDRDDLEGLLEVRLTGDDTLSMQPADLELTAFEVEVRIPAGERFSERFEYELPLDLPTDYEYTIEASFRDERVRLPFLIQTRYAAELLIPDVLGMGEPAEVVLVLENLTEEPIYEILAELVTPVGVAIPDGEITQTLGTLEPGNRTAFVWRIVPESPSEVAAFVVEIRTYNGGNTRLWAGREVLGHDPLGTTAAPSLPASVPER